MRPLVVDELSSVGRTVSIDLTIPELEIISGYKRQLRQNLSRNEELGMTTEIDLEWRYLDDFAAMYDETMRRNKASAFYFFSREYLQNLKQALGSHGLLVLVKIKGNPAAAVLLIEYRGLATVHLACTAAEYQSLSPGKTAFHEAAMWARRRGNRCLHLGGGRGASDRDPLFLFKMAFCPRAHARTFGIGRWILNQTCYDGLTKAHTAFAANNHQQLDPGYFPAYRAPVSNARPEEVHV
ncbi:MAG: GNAT family N-acetyltransferase [Acidobacteriaceae bacterium]|nr:GNAT family N-acetyltransferase [Acidobacteriaceae bacterium]